MRKKTLFGVVLGSFIMLSCIHSSSFAAKVEAAEVKEPIETAAQDSEFEILDMPIVSITTDEDTELSSANDYVNAKIEVVAEDGTMDMEQADMSIRLRGNSTAAADKKSYKIKFDKKQNPLSIGDGKGKTWGLLANPFDVSLLRNLTMYHFGDKLDNIPYSPNCKSVEVLVNGEYQGVYLMTELVNVNKNRVNVAEEIDEVEDNGYLVEMSCYAEGSTFMADAASYEIKSDLSEDETIKGKQIDYISDYVNQCVKVLKEGDQKTIEEYMDVDTLVDVYIANEIVKNVDAGWDSVYMSKDAGGKLQFGPLWDYDLTMSNVDSVLGIDAYEGFSPYTILNVNACSNPWLCYAMENQWFREKVKARWNELQSDIDDLSKNVIREAEENYDSYLRNFDRWDIIGTQVYTQPKYITAMTSYKEHYTYLSEWLEKRTAWLTEQINGDDFIKGIFYDNSGNILSSDSNIFSMSSLLALGMEGNFDYEILEDTIGLTFDIHKGGFLMLDVSGFMMEEGQEYEISFDYSSTKEASTSFAVQENHAPYTAFLTGDLELKPEVQHVKQTFIAPKQERNGAFVINLMGEEYEGAVVTIDNMKLVKKSAPEKKSDITAELNVTGDWGTGAVCSLTITNDTDKDMKDGWGIDFDFNREIKQLWNGQLSSSEDGRYTLTNPVWKPVLAAGESYTVGFLVSGGTEFELTNVTSK